jgi:acetyl esterase/lipase
LKLFAGLLLLAMAASRWWHKDLHAASGAAAAPPQQPATGPGGRDYSYGEVRKSVFGEGSAQYWIFEPAGAVAAPASGAAAHAALPVIVFLHGWGAMEPGGYGAWIEHIVRRGNIVIYPRYQENLRTPMKDFTPNAVGALKAALKEVAAGGHATPDLKRMAVVGHSMGGAVAPNIAALAAQEGLPQFSVVMCVEPGKARMPMADLSQIRANTLMLVLTGDDDRIVRGDTAREIFQSASNVAPANKNFVTLMSDDHGTPPLRANHFAPAAPGGNFQSSPSDGSASERGALRERLSERLRGEKKEGAQRMVDALDFYGTWKLFDGLTDAAFFGKNREYALGNTPQQRFMGKWSDGVPVKELRIEPGGEK